MTAALLISLACADYARCPARVESRARTVAALIDAVADEGAPPRLMASLAWHESGIKRRALSRAGAIGLAQLLPGGFEADLCAGLKWRTSDAANVRCGARVLASLVAKCGLWSYAITAYNRGGKCGPSEWGSMVARAAR